MNKSRDDLLEKLLQIEEQVRASAGEDDRLIRDRMKLIARLASYVRRQLQLSGSHDFDATLPFDDTGIVERRA